MRLFLVRHGLTVWNNEYRYQGHTNIELSPEGRIQALALQLRLKNEKIDAIYSSDLLRALETAEIINQAHQLEIKILSDFKEVNFGIWEGLTYKDLQQQYPDQLKTWLETPHLLNIENGESFNFLLQRALSAFQTVFSQHPNGNVVIVSHGGTIASLLCGLRNEPLEKMWTYKQKNAALNILNIIDSQATIELLNDTSHLDNGYF